MAYRGRIRRLENQSGLFILIPQPDGTVRRFPKSALGDAYVSNLRRACGEDIPEHPLTTAAKLSGNPERYIGTLLGDAEPGGEPEDLSE
jgi:hypothetical protein